MKKLIIIVSFFVSINNTFSQNVDYNGIYLTADDFVNNNLHLKGDNKQVKINAGLAFNPSHIRVKFDGKKYYFHKDSIWGIAGNKQIYRFSNKDNCVLIANSGFMLYSYRDNGRHMRLYYYFSESASSQVLPLSMKNLDKSFIENKKFHELLQAKISKDEDLAAYDKKSKTYKIVNIYNLSLEK
ncbi:MAG: hypothetical protein U0W24_00700 [Bacteroidales bacterium]